ncbi:MAG: glutathione S-transferase family protein [Polyangiaceae bacterium]
MIKLFGNPASTCTRKVLMTLHELGAPFEMNVIDFTKGDHKQPAHLKRQPFGRIPAIDDDGFALFESRAICRYLNEKAKGNLEPADIQGRARMEQWISIETSELTPNAMKFVYEHVFKRPQGEAVLENATKGLDVTCGVMDTRLAESPFLAGKDFSIAEISMMPYFEYAMTTPAKATFAKYPHVMQWWNKIAERPAWAKTTGKA